MMDEMSTVTGKMILTGKLILKTPLIIGSGEKSDGIDILVLKDENDNPYIPATSMVGALRHCFYQKVDMTVLEKNKQQFNYFWGSDETRRKENTYQSALALKDLLPEKNVIVKVRDGVAINSDTGVAEQRKKYDYEVVEPGAVFKFEAEITLRKAYVKQVFLQIVKFLVSVLEEGDFSLGAMTTKGFGRCKLETPLLYDYDFTEKHKVIAWLNKDINNDFCIDTGDVEIFLTKKVRNFCIEAVFALQSSLIVRSYSGNLQAPDAVHLTCNKKNVLPGTSIKGAIRNRAQRIINTLGGQGQEELKKLFGWVDTEEESKEKCKSRLVVEETIIDNVTEAIQSRIKIDRFTGGVITGALFDSMPLWAVEGKQEMVKINITIKDYHDWEAGLMLLMLKDLWTGDLPLGGEKSIGRGILQGIRAGVMFNDQSVIIKSGTGKQLQIVGDRKELEKFVAALNERIRGRKEKAYGAGC